MNSELESSVTPLYPVLSISLSLLISRNSLLLPLVSFSLSFFPPSVPPLCGGARQLRSLNLLGGISESMNRWVYEQNAMAACQEMRMESVVCPKPRRLVLQTPPENDPIRTHRWPINHSKTGNSKAGAAELLDIILTKEGYSENLSQQLASSPPFFWGSPPSRASNPVVQDEQFGHNTYQLCEVPPSPSSSSSRKGGGCVRMKFGHGPAAVRIEGFDCLKRDARNCSISAVA